MTYDPPTAPALVMDLLVAHGGALPVAALCRAGTLFGMDGRVIRVALSRLLAQAKVQRTDRGCYSVQHGQKALTDAVDGWWQRALHCRPWQGHWVAVVDGDVGRHEKTPWRHHALALQLRGFATLAPGLQLRPDNLAGGVDAERARLQQLGLSPRALVMGMHTLDAGTQKRARTLWHDQSLPQRYRALATQLQRSARQLPRRSLAQGTHESLLLGRTVIAHLLRDPLLPPELMDARPRERLQESMRVYQEQARAICRAYLADPPEP